MQLPNLGALSLHPAVSAPGPSVVEIDEPDDEDVYGVEVNPGGDDDEEYLEVGADDVVTHEYEEEKEERAVYRPLGGDVATHDAEHEEEDDEEDEAAALAALNASGFGRAERELIERKKQEEAPRWTVESKRKRKQKSEAEMEAARLERNRKQRERNAAKSVEGVVEKLIKQVEAQNAQTNKPEVIDLTVDDDDAPEEEKKKKKMTWWMIREEDPRTPKERHPYNEGTYDRLEPRKGSKGPRFKPPVPESDDELPPSPRSPPTMPAPELYS